jgi:hypothetical protein
LATIVSRKYSYVVRSTGGFFSGTTAADALPLSALAGGSAAPVAVELEDVDPGTTLTLAAAATAAWACSSFCLSISLISLAMRCFSCTTHLRRFLASRHTALSSFSSSSVLSYAASSTA